MIHQIRWRDVYRDGEIDGSGMADRFTQVNRDKELCVDWICCQIGAREHYSIARALHRRGRLGQLITDLWLRPRNPLARLNQKLAERFEEELKDAYVSAPNLGSVAREVRNRLMKRSGWPAIIARNEWFQRMAVERLRQSPAGGPRRTIFAYSYAARDILRYAREQGWRTVLGQIDPGRAEERIVERLHAEYVGARADWTPAPSHYWRQWQEECDLADFIVVNSRWAYEALIGEGIAEEKIKIIPLAYEPPPACAQFARFYSDRFDEQRPLRALFLGQINLRKGVGPLFDAIRLLKGEPIEFWFVGPQQVATPPDLVNHSQIRWVGPVPRGCAQDYYRDADLFLFPTISDGFGLTQLEAQAWKLPVIASQFCGDVVQDGVNGLILRDVEPTTIAGSLRALAADPARLRALSSGAGIDERFSLDTLADNLLKL